jgi:hypothetical protein
MFVIDIPQSLRLGNLSSAEEIAMYPLMSFEPVCAMQLAATLMTIVTAFFSLCFLRP